jgi:hypothetical protein
MKYQESQLPAAYEFDISFFLRDEIGVQKYIR